MRTTKYPNDMKALVELGLQRQEFEAWMKALDAEHKTLGAPYGSGDIWDMTGPACWISFFKDGYTPREALEEDFSNA